MLILTLIELLGLVHQKSGQNFIIYHFLVDLLQAGVAEAGMWDQRWLWNIYGIVKRIRMGLPNIFLTTLNTAVSLVLLSLSSMKS